MHYTHNLFIQPEEPDRRKQNMKGVILSRKVGGPLTTANYTTQQKTPINNTEENGNKTRHVVLYFHVEATSRARTSLSHISKMFSLELK